MFGRGVEIYDPKNGRLLYPLPEQDAQVKWLTWSPNSQRLALSLDNGELAIWNVAEIEKVLAGLQIGP
jgi:WD40 repeat protein